MQNLKDHFNRNARRRQASEFLLVLWILLLMLIEMQRRLESETRHGIHRFFRPG